MNEWRKSTPRRGIAGAMVAGSLALSGAAAVAQDSDATAEQFDKFRALMEESSPAELFEARGENLWKTKRGPKNASL
ncbi:MAG: sulfur oxidation c-type cytochrome SoxA, partial [Burkholderiales bacterium]